MHHKRVLYVRSHLSRKEKYRILTRIVRSDKGTFVLKSPISSEAVQHIDNIVTNETLCAKELKGIVSVLKSNRDNNDLVYKFLTEESLQIEMEKAIQAQDFIRLNELFFEGLTLIRKIPSRVITRHPDENGYIDLFGTKPSLFYPMASVGCLDITAGNLIKTKGLFTLLDCEWVVNFPIELRFIEFRYLWNLIVGFTSLFHLYGSRMDLFSLSGTDLLVPKSWIVMVFGTTESDQFNHFLQKEIAFQSNVLAFQKIEISSDVEFVSYLSDEFIWQGGLREAMNKISTLEQEKEGMTQQLVEIQHSKFWKLINLYKNPRATAMRNINKVYLKLIRLQSKIRRDGLLRAFFPTTIKSSDLSTLKFRAGGVVSKGFHRQVDVIIPVFNSYSQTIRCINSVLKTIPKGTTVYIIDDLSTENDLRTYYKSISKKSNIKIIYNTERQGFVKNINIGFESSENDVIILNSDTEVSSNWLEKLHKVAYSFPNVGTVTPMTNNGEILSIPTFLKSNEMLTGFSLEEHNRLTERFSSHAQIELPTGVGFCMYVRRELLNSIGGFNEVEFGMGYGEENDFCQRAIIAGFSNIVDDSTYVFHEGTSSFTSEEKQQYIEANLKKLSLIHPTYEKQVAKFIFNNPLKYMQELFLLVQNHPEFLSDPSILLVMHKNPFAVIGGVEMDVRRMLASIGPSPLFLVLHRDNEAKENKLFIELVKNGVIVHQLIFSFDKPLDFLELEHSEVEGILTWLMQVFTNVKVVHLENTHSLPISALKVFGQSKRDVFLNFHDFYYVCPFEKLVTPDVPEFIDLHQNISECYNSLSSVFGSSERVESYKRQRMRLVTELFGRHVSKFIFNSNYMLNTHKQIWPKIFSKNNSIVIEPYV